MFLFMVGGVRQQVREILEREAATCLRCGHPAHSVSYDNVLELFFCPVWRWPAKQPAVFCNNCGFLLPDTTRFHASHDSSLPPLSPPPPPNAVSARCWSCSRSLQPDFHFCPDCGARTHP